MSFFQKKYFILKTTSRTKQSLNLHQGILPFYLSLYFNINYLFHPFDHIQKNLSKL